MLKQLSSDVSQYRHLAGLLWKYGHFDLAKGIGVAEHHKSVDDEGVDNSPQALAKDLEQMGTAYIKLAQLASTREDLIPPEYIKALSRLQNDVKPVQTSVIREQIESSLGASISQLFQSFEDQPLATASLGQVHRAVLRDGRDVVVKVKRQGVGEQATEQLVGLKRLAKLADTNTDLGRKFRFDSLVGAVDYALSIELDYRREANNLLNLSEQLRSFARIAVPLPIDQMVRQDVLAMEYFAGTAISSVSPVVLNELDTNLIAEDLVRAYLQQILIDGFFHADPHPGNLLLREDHSIGLLDGGMCVAIAPTLRREIASLLLAISEGEGENAASITHRIATAEDKHDLGAFRTEAARIIAASTASGKHEKMSLGRTIVRFVSAAGANGFVLPYELILLSKAFLQLETTLNRLAPSLDTKAVIRGYTVKLLAERGREQLSLGRLAASALESADLASSLPQRINRITQMVAENGLSVKVDAIDEESLLKGVHKIANRITAGLIVSAMLVAAALLMRIKTGPTVFGHPVLAIILLFVAMPTAVYLLYLALVRDRKP